MEEIDRRIVSLLSRNGRMSFTELARQAGLSVSAVHQRVRRLETDGVITGYVALCNPDVIGLPLTAFVSIKPFDQAAPDDVPDKLKDLEAIEACHSVAGEENYILKVRVASPTGPGGPAAADPYPRERLHAHHGGAFYRRTRTGPRGSDTTGDGPARAGRRASCRAAGRCPAAPVSVAITMPCTRRSTSWALTSGRSTPACCA